MNLLFTFPHGEKRGTSHLPFPELLQKTDTLSVERKPEGFLKFYLFAFFKIFIER